MHESEVQRFPTSAGVVLGLGLGAFFDGIVFHQLLQWHHMVSGWYPLNSIDNVILNTTWDGIFHSAAYVLVLAGLYLFWQRSRANTLSWSPSYFVGAILLGWGIFDLVEGIIDHEIFGLHRVNETVSPDYRIFWDIGFLLWGAAMVVVGALMVRDGAQRTADAQGSLQAR
jgi:uncharacterized membrane protein